MKIKAATLGDKCSTGFYIIDGVFRILVKAGVYDFIEDSAAESFMCLERRDRFFAEQVGELHRGFNTFGLMTEVNIDGAELFLRFCPILTKAVPSKNLNGS